VEAGRLLVEERVAKNPEDIMQVRMMFKWLAFGMFFTVFGAILSIFSPLNKKIWSISFANFTGGVGILVLLLCYYMVDVFPWKDSKIITITSKPFIWLGTNPLAVFIGMIFLELLLLDWLRTPWANIYYQGNLVSAWVWIYWVVFQSWIKPYYFASLFVSLVHLLLWVIVSGLMHWRKIFVKL